MQYLFIFHVQDLFFKNDVQQKKKLQALDLLVVKNLVIFVVCGEYLI